MIRDMHLQHLVAVKLVKDNDENRANHIPSGKLGAGNLKWPTQWQVLKAIGVPEKPLDEYVLRTFVRGRQVEKWVKEQMPGLLDEEVFLEYKGAVGYADTIVDTAEWGVKVGVISREVKSVKNSKFRWFEKKVKENKPDAPTEKDSWADLGHRWQATLYALARGDKHYAIDYIASDDLRVLSLVYQTDSTAQQVESIIEDFHSFTKAGKIPIFTPRLKWQANPDYQMYEEWANLTPEQAEDKLKQQFPKQFLRLKNYSAYIEQVEEARKERASAKEEIRQS